LGTLLQTLLIKIVSNIIPNFTVTSSSFNVCRVMLLGINPSLFTNSDDDSLKKLLGKCKALLEYVQYSFRGKSNGESTN